MQIPMQEWVEKLLSYAAPRIRMRGHSGVQLGQVEGPVTVINVYMGKDCDCCHIAQERSSVVPKAEG